MKAFAPIVLVVALFAAVPLVVHSNVVLNFLVVALMIALAGQGAGLDVVGYTSQARFLLNAGIGDLLANATLRERADAQKLLNEHEMGELFKVIAFAKGLEFTPLGFASGDRRHRL